MARRTAVGTLAGVVLCTALAVACTPPSGRTPPATHGAATASELGPYPLNVVVRQGTYEFAPTHVRVQGVDELVRTGPHLGPPNYIPEGAQPGHRLVEVTLDDRDTSMSRIPKYPYSDRSFPKTAPHVLIPLPAGHENAMENFIVALIMKII